MSVRCQNCKYWIKNTEFESSRVYGHCTLSETSFGTAIHPDNEGLAFMFRAQDYESYRAALETSPEFSCIAGIDKTYKPAPITTCNYCDEEPDNTGACDCQEGHLPCHFARVSNEKQCIKCYACRGCAKFYANP